MSAEPVTITTKQQEILSLIREGGDGITLSKDRLARATSCSRVTADRAIKVLRNAGLIEVVSNSRADGGGAANTYRATRDSIPYRVRGRGRPVREGSPKEL